MTVAATVAVDVVADVTVAVAEAVVKTPPALGTALSLTATTAVMPGPAENGTSWRLERESMIPRLYVSARHERDQSTHQ